MKITSKHLAILKELAHKVWGKYDNIDYRTEKQSRNESISIDNPDNVWFFWNQFDYKNHKKILYGLLFYPACQERTDLISWAIPLMTAEQEAIINLGIDL